MRLIDADAVLDRYYAEYERQDICDGAEDREWLMKCLNEAPTLTPPNEWVSVEDTVPDPGERVLATDGIFVGEAYRTSADSWHRHTGFPWRDGVTGRTVKYWMPLPAPPGKDNNVSTKEQNEPLTIEQLREMDGDPVWIVDVGPHKWCGPGWAIVDRDNCLVRTVKNWNAVFFESYGERWLAYRRPPEEET